jgi:hypothetical protein
MSEPIEELRERVTEILGEPNEAVVDALLVFATNEVARIAGGEMTARWQAEDELKRIAKVNGALHRSADIDAAAALAELSAIDAEMDEFASRHNPECECEVIHSTREVVRRIKAAISAPESPADARTPVTAATEAHGGAGEAQEGSQ